MKKIINAYRRCWNGAFEVLEGKMTDEEAQKAIRGINAKNEDFLEWAKKDILANKENKGKKLQIKVECDYDYRSYLIYLKFV